MRPHTLLVAYFCVGKNRDRVGSKVSSIPKRDARRRWKTSQKQFLGTLRSYVVSPPLYVPYSNLPIISPGRDIPVVMRKRNRQNRVVLSAERFNEHLMCLHVPNSKNFVIRTRHEQSPVDYRERDSSYPICARAQRIHDNSPIPSSHVKSGSCPSITHWECGGEFLMIQHYGPS